MEPMTAGELVKVATGGPDLDGIVFDVPSRTKVVVALVDDKRGPVFRTVDAATVSERPEKSAVDGALRALIRRTPAPVHGSSPGATDMRRGQAGHARATMHRTTGK